MFVLTGETYLARLKGSILSPSAMVGCASSYFSSRSYSAIAIASSVSCRILVKSLVFSLVGFFIPCLIIAIIGSMSVPVLNLGRFSIVIPSLK